jgi:hypothetical protein
MIGPVISPALGANDERRRTTRSGWTWYRMNMERIVAIDPGLAGGVAVLDLDDGQVVQAAGMRTPTVVVRRGGNQAREYDLHAMYALLAEAVHGCEPGQVHVVVERQQAMPRHLRGRTQGVGSSFKAGVGFGLWCGFVVALKLAFTIVAPAVWKKTLQLLGTNKAAARLRAQELLPQLGPLNSAAEGIAEASLLALYVVARLPGRLARDAGENAAPTPRDAIAAAAAGEAS